MRVALAVLALIVAAPQVEAQSEFGPNWRTIRQRQWVCRDWGGCGYEWRTRRIRTYEQPRYYASPREYSLEREVERRHCGDMVRAVGVEKYGKERAKEAADASWMEIVRASPGAKFMDMRNAKHLTYECWQSSTGNRASEKAADVGGKFLEQCEVRAHPCRAPRVEGERDDR